MIMHYSKNSDPQFVSGAKGIIFVVILLTTLSIVAYHDITNNFFSCDDFVWLKNAQISVQHPLNIFTKDIAGWFRPLGHLVFAVNYLLFDVTYPVAYVIVSIIVHIITAFFVFVLTAILLRNRIVALWAAMFFVIQHTHWEAVAWSSIVAEELAALWFILTIICFLKWREYSESPQTQSRKMSARWYRVFAHIALVCGFLSAESVVTIPAMLLLTDIFYHSKVWKRSPVQAIIPHISFSILWGIYVCYELWIQRHGHHLGESGDYKVNLEFFLTLFRSLLAYIVPRPLLLYILQSQHLTLTIFAVWTGLIVLGVFILIFIKINSSHYKHILYGGLWTVITMLPFCGFIRFAIIDSRQFYLSSVGVSLIFGLAVYSFYKSIYRDRFWIGMFQKTILGIGIFGIFTWNILEIWYEEARFEAYASEGAQVLNALQQSYPEFSSDAQLYFSGLYTPQQFFADMIQVYYSLNSSQVHYVGSEKMKKLQQQKTFEEPTYLLARHMGQMHDLTPDQYKYVLPKDGKIDIGGETAQKYLVQGFSHPEIWVDGFTTFVWSRKSTSTIKVRFPAQDNDMAMVLRIFPFQFPGLPQQSVEILVDDQILDTLQLHNDLATYEILIPKALISPKVNTIQFRYAYTASPSEMSNGQIKDGRRLAVAFDYILFRMK